MHRSNPRIMRLAGVRRRDLYAVLPRAAPLPGGERPDRACAIRVRGTVRCLRSVTPAPGMDARDAPIPTSPSELGFPRVRLLKWPNSDISDFGWGEVKSRCVVLIGK